MLRSFPYVACAQHQLLPVARVCKLADGRVSRKRTEKYTRLIICVILFKLTLARHTHFTTSFTGLLKVVEQIQKKFPELKEVYAVQESWLAKLGACVIMCIWSCDDVLSACVRTTLVTLSTDIRSISKVYAPATWDCFVCV